MTDGVLTATEFCGVNVIAYYSTAIFISAKFQRSDALLVSLGTGIVNWLCELPSYLPSLGFPRPY
jgi:hypothetical protein